MRITNNNIEVVRVCGILLIAIYILNK